MSTTTAGTAAAFATDIHIRAAVTKTGKSSNNHSNNEVKGKLGSSSHFYLTSQNV